MLEHESRPFTVHSTHLFNIQPRHGSRSNNPAWEVSLTLFNFRLVQLRMSGPPRARAPMLKMAVIDRRRVWQRGSYNAGLAVFTRGECRGRMGGTGGRGGRGVVGTISELFGKFRRIGKEYVGFRVSAVSLPDGSQS